MAGWLRRSRGTLLSEPIDSLLAAVEQDQYERALAETAAATAPGSQQCTPGRRRSGGAASGAAGGRSSLWVEKYAPRAYIDLLSDEQINRCGWGCTCGGSALVCMLSWASMRQLLDFRHAGAPCCSSCPLPCGCSGTSTRFCPLCLTCCNCPPCFIWSLFYREVVRWLKGWDPAVFGTAAPEQLAREACGVGSRFRPLQQQGQRQFGSGSGGGGSDPLGRPEHKVILIAGPPGGLHSRGCGVAGWCPAAGGLQGDCCQLAIAPGRCGPHLEG